MLKADSIHAVIDHLKKELAALFVGLHLNAAALAYLLRPPPTGVQRVFKSVGQQHAKVAFGQRQSMGQLRVDGQGNPLCGGPPRKGGKNQIGGLVFAVDRNAAGFNLIADRADIGLRLCVLTVSKTRGEILQMMAQIVAVGPGLILGFPHGLNFPHRLVDL